MFRKPPPVVLNLVIINVIIFVFQQLGTGFNIPIFQYIDVYFLHLWKSNLIISHPTTIALESGGYAAAPSLNVVQVFTHFFAHGGLFHLIFNMIALVSIGSLIEMTIGKWRFLEFYLFCGIVGGLLIAFFDPLHGAVVGASGAISGVLVAMAIYYPNAPLQIFFIPYPIKARTLVIGFASISAVLVIVEIVNGSSLMGVSNFGHLAGMAAGFAYLNFRKAFNKIRGK